MSSFLSVNAVELSQEELNMVEGGTLCLVTGIIGSILGGLGKCTPTPSPCVPAPSPCVPKPPKCGSSDRY